MSGTDSMRNRRRAKIIELISSREISTQKEILDALVEAGFDATQATVSRDVRGLGLVKHRSPSGAQCYALRDRRPNSDDEAMLRIFRDTVVSIELSMNLLVLRTLTAGASAAAEAIDQLAFPGVLGTIAGENTVFVAAASEEAARETAARFSLLLHT